VVVEGIVHGHDQTFQLSTVSIGRPSLVVPRLAVERSRLRSLHSFITCGQLDPLAITSRRMLL
jgi:hypothetical protein